MPSSSRGWRCWSQSCGSQDDERPRLGDGHARAVFVWVSFPFRGSAAPVSRLSTAPPPRLIPWPTGGLLVRWALREVQGCADERRVFTGLAVIRQSLVGSGNV